MATQQRSERLTYGRYLRVPELLSLQTPLSEPQVHGEMLFIITQQSQELWFKQILHELRTVIRLLESRELPEATHILDRVDRMLRVLGEEIEILEGLPPAEFQQFRGKLETASGFESKQFRELELASGLDDPDYLRMVSRFVDLEEVGRRWPKSLQFVFLEVVRDVDADPIEALVRIYADPSAYADHYRLAEAVSDYEIRFSKWRFHHIELVLRVIGDRSPGTGGSTGGVYLAKTLQYRFFPELWEARNRLTERIGQH